MICLFAYVDLLSIFSFSWCQRLAVAVLLVIVALPGLFFFTFKKIFSSSFENSFMSIFQYIIY